MLIIHSFASGAVKGQILCLNRLEDTVKDVEFIFECIYEDLEAKQAIFESRWRSELDPAGKIDLLGCVPFAPPNVILCTSTMRLDLDKLSENLPHKEVRSLNVDESRPQWWSV